MCTLTKHFAVTGCNRRGRLLRLARFLDRDLIPCGSAGSGLSDAAVRQIRAALDAKEAVIVTVKFRGFTPSGELCHPVIRGWQRSSWPCTRVTADLLGTAAVGPDDDVEHARDRGDD
jgi:bifunctional non-homologous end joining protein LigD